MCWQTLMGCDPFVMLVCGSVAGGKLYGSRMGCHGNILLKTNGREEKQRQKA